MIDKREILENSILDDIFNYKIKSWQDLKLFYNYRNDEEKLGYIQNKKQEFAFYILYNELCKTT